jgi:putative ABC transport system permease protein
MSFLSGVTMLLGAVWVLAYNAGALRRLRGSGALWRLSTAYVASNRFRTGLTLTMFALVVLSLTVSAVLLTATRLAYADPAALTGGWDIHAQSTQPPRDVAADLAGGGVMSPAAFSAIGAASTLSVEGIQVDSSVSRRARWASVSVVSVDRAFADAARTPLVGGDAAAWHTLATAPGTAIVGAGVLAPRQNGLQLLDSEGRGFRPTTLWIRDLRAPGRPVRLNVIAIADGRGPIGNTVIVNSASLAAWPAPDTAGYYFAVPAAANARELAAGLNLALPDLTASTISDELRLVEGVRGLLNMILEGFMGVGLLAGVAALGTLSTRAVIERRRQIGVLRALGFSARAVSAGLLIESALVAALGAGLGVALGLQVARGTVSFLGRASPELRFSIPWEQIALVVLVTMAAGLLMTALPARQAARLAPAEALRDA